MELENYLEIRNSNNLENGHYERNTLIESRNGKPFQQSFNEITSTNGQTYKYDIR